MIILLIYWNYISEFGRGVNLKRQLLNIEMSVSNMAFFELKLACRPDKKFLANNYTKSCTHVSIERRIYIDI